ncbi:response regulator [Treponema sp.]|uniref:response regulator n=1 Tax=Treponema sp. TaxID=166 RepID=UPI00388F7B26
MSKKSEEKSVVYSALEVARICGVVNQTSINWIKNGHLKAFKTPGGQFRVYPDDLVEFMKLRDMRIPADVLAQCSNDPEENRKIKILFVDDDESFNNVSVSLLQKNLPDAEIFQAFDGFEAGSMAVKKMPDCLILDLSLPGIDGIKICQTIKSSDAFGKPEIIIVTGMEDEEMEKTCRDLGVKYYFKKPVFIPELVTAVKDLMSVQ